MGSLDRYVCLSDADSLEHILVSSLSDRVGFFRLCEMFLGGRMAGGG